LAEKIKPQKALHKFQEADKKNPKYIGHDYAVFEKHDGWFGYLDFPSCKIHSRACREIPALQELSNKIREVRPDCKGRLIFEIMIEGLEVDSFPELNGILNRKYEQAEDVYIKVHDYLPDWNFELPFRTRYNYATEIVDRLRLPEVRMSAILGVSGNPSVWHSHAEKIWEFGGEGVILKRIDAPYSPEKRNFDLMKIKEELTLDLKVVGMFEGEGKYIGTLGGLIVLDKFNLEHRVSGMTDVQRDMWWQDPTLIKGKIVEIKAMKRLKDGSLREPRFKAVRWDKVETDD